MPASKTIGKIGLKIDKLVSIFRFSSGFTLIELMVVVSLFGLAASLITASYLTFERNQRVRNGVELLKGDLRFIQNKTTSGDKGPGGTFCSATVDNLGGWYLTVARDASSFSYGGVCIKDPNVNNWSLETTFETRVVNLPSQTKIRKVSHPLDLDVSESVSVFFKPLASGAEYFDSSLVFSPVDFYVDTTGVTRSAAYISPAPVGTVSIEVSNDAENRCYYVRITQSGEISGEQGNCS